MFKQFKQPLYRIIILIVTSLFLTACLSLFLSKIQPKKQPNEPQQITRSSGTIHKNESQSYSMPVSQVNILTLLLIADRADVSLLLVNPSGETVAAEMSRKPNRGAEAGEYRAQIQVENPMEGEWTATITSQDTSAYTLLSLSNTTRLSVQVDNYRHPTGEPVTFYATLTNHGKIFYPSSVRMNLYQGNHFINVFEFRDNGVDPDKKARDGIYSLRIPYQKSGQFHAEVTAKEGYIQRQESISFQYVQPNAVILGIKDEYLFDENKDGLAESLQIVVEVDIKRKGQYVLSALLDDKNKKPISSATFSSLSNAILYGGEKELTEGVQTFILSFSGQDIRYHRVDGPYIIRLYIEDVAQDAIIYDLPEAYISTSYKSTDFAR